MIISHKYKFIFFKAAKVAGTSIEIALAKHCGETDIITPLIGFRDGRNYEDKKFFNHMRPKEIKNKIGEEIFDNYYKFTVVRNPWDQVVSRYWWTKEKGFKLTKQEINIKKVLSLPFNPDTYKFVVKRILFNPSLPNYIANKTLCWVNRKDPFDNFIYTYDNKNWGNTSFYFDENGKPICDFYIKYEHLDKDYETVCNKLHIPYEKLLRTRVDVRKDKKHYSHYYNDKTQKIVHDWCKKEIDFFDYKFERE